LLALERKRYHSANHQIVFGVELLENETAVDADGTD
jgi:hypothetical protein